MAVLMAKIFTGSPRNSRMHRFVLGLFIFWFTPKPLQEPTGLVPPTQGVGKGAGTGVSLITERNFVSWSLERVMPTVAVQSGAPAGAGAPAGRGAGAPAGTPSGEGVVMLWKI